VESIFKNGSLSVWSAGSDEDILLAIDGSNDSSGKHELLPGLINVVVVNSFLVSAVSIVLHYLSTVLSSNVNLYKISQRTNQVLTDAASIKARSMSLDFE